MNDYSSPLRTGLKTEECLRREAVIEFIREKRKYPTISDADIDWIIKTQQKFGKLENWDRIVKFLIIVNQ